MYTRKFLETRDKFIRAMRELVAASVVATQNACDQYAVGEEIGSRSAMESKFHSQLRMAWHDHIVPLVPKASFDVEEIPVAALGRIYGALHAHLDAIYAWRKELDRADDTLFDQSEVSKKASADAAAAGAKYLGLVNDVFDGLVKEYAKNRKIASQLAADIYTHATKNGQAARLVGSLKSMYVAKATWNRIHIRANYDEHEPLTLELEEVFSTEQDREQLLALVRQAFGKGAKLEKTKIETCNLAEAFVRPVTITAPIILPLQIVLPDPDCCKIGNLK